MRYKLIKAARSWEIVDAEVPTYIYARAYDKKLGDRLVKMLNNNEDWKEKAAKLKKPSDEFQSALTDTGSCSIDCELCGRFHFTDEEQGCGEYTEEEWAEFLEKAEANPDKYVYHGGWGVFISWGYVDGKQAVADCECNRSRRYEDWIWSHRYLITDYLKNVAREWAEEAERLASLVNIDEENLVKEDLEIEGRVQRPSR